MKSGFFVYKKVLAMNMQITKILTIMLWWLLMINSGKKSSWGEELAFKNALAKELTQVE